MIAIICHDIANKEIMSRKNILNTKWTMQYDHDMYTILKHKQKWNRTSPGCITVMIFAL